jgi:leader peptidase (prepilin peptidase)/N-methyltransferase
VNPLLIAGLMLAGSVIGWYQQALIARYAVPAGQPPQRGPAHDGRARPGRWLPWPLRTPAGGGPAGGGRTGPPALAVGATTATLLGALAFRVHPGPVLAAACWLAVWAVPLAFIDVAVHRLPDALTAPAYAGTATLLLLGAATSGRWDDLLRAGLGGLALAGFYVALIFIAPSGMGMGDTKLSASTGTLLAWLSWGTLVTGAVAGFVLGGLYGIGLLALRGATRKQQIPFGPFLIAGAFAVIIARPP